MSTIEPTFFGDFNFGDFLFGGMLAGEGGVVALPGYKWQVNVGLSDLSTFGQLEPTSLEMHLKYRDIGTWSTTYSWDGNLTTPAAQLVLPGSRLFVVLNDSDVIMSGPNATLARSVDGDDIRTVSVGGVDDAVILADRVGHPMPGHAAPPYNVQTADVHGPGPAETVIKEFVDTQCGPGAVARRRAVGLSIESDLARGTSVKDQAAWKESILTLVQRLAIAGAVGFRVVQLGSGLGRQFQVFVPNDKTNDVVFSIKLGNTSGYKYGVQRPAANYVYALGSGSGIAQTVQEGQDAASVAAWGLIEDVLDSTDTADSVILGQRINAELAAKSAQYSVALTALDTRGHQWARVATDASVGTYDLGDTVSIDIEGVQVPQTIQEIVITVDKDGTRIVPLIGTPGHTNPAMSLFQALINIAKANRIDTKKLKGRS